MLVYPNKAVFEFGNDRGEDQRIELFIKKQKNWNLIETIIHDQLFFRNFQGLVFNP